ncbi:MAG: AraC family transcriptional regulator [Saprospiraceae bacterium]|nr:AraC family transcriptional regulator [Saprospiraceae bacterium]
MEDIIIFSYNEKSSVLLVFFFNAMVFSYLLLKRGLDENQKHSLWLAAFILLGSWYICPFMLGYAGWYSEDGYREFMFFVPFQQLFLIGPVFFFYIKTLLNKDFKLNRRDFIHFLPAIIYMVYSIIVFVGDMLIFDAFYFYADGEDKDLDFWYQMTGLLSMLYYLINGLVYYWNYRKISVEEVSFADEIAFKWIKYFTIAFGLILVLRVLFFILNPEWGEFGSKYWYYLCFSILLMYISITGYSNTVKTSMRFDANDLEKLEPIRADENIGSKNEPENTLILDEWNNKITKLFEKENIYENPNLTLSQIATLLHTNRNIISKVINQKFKMNFNDFVNEKRAEAVIQKLQNGEHLKNTLLSIAMDCGFNSKTTFNRAFKKHTALTPKQYILKNKL